MVHLKEKIKWHFGKNSYIYKSNGKIFSDRKLYTVVAQEVAQIEKKFETLTDQLINQDIQFFQWQYEMSNEIRSGHISMLRLGRGGKDQVLDENYLEVGRNVKNLHYPKLKEFAKDIKEGKLSPKQIKARARLYARATRRSFEYGRKTTKRNKVARRKLGSCAPHCPDCIRYAGYGWVSLTDLILPTEKCECMANCCCSVEYK